MDDLTYIVYYKKEDDVIWTVDDYHYTFEEARNAVTSYEGSKYLATMHPRPPCFGEGLYIYD